VHLPSVNICTSFSTHIIPKIWYEVIAVKLCLFFCTCCYNFNSFNLGAFTCPNTCVLQILIALYLYSIVTVMYASFAYMIDVTEGFWGLLLASLHPPTIQRPTCSPISALSLASYHPHSWLTAIVLAILWWVLSVMFIDWETGCQHQ
jgi:hypothetical protein